METQKIHWQPQPKQSEALVRTENEILYGGARGGGKDISLSTLVLTKNGWKEAKDITYTDILFSQNGEETKIVGIYPKKNREMYRITFVDGRSVVCDKEHNWSVYSKNHGHRDGWIVRKTIDLFKNPKDWSIPLCENIPGIKWVGADPYIIGYILGDGTLTADKEIIYTVDLDTIQYLEDRGWKSHKYPYMNTTMCNPVGEETYKYQKILGKVSKENKKIPEELLLADYNTRLSILQGLMDSDGHCDKEGRVSFCNKSLDLCVGVQILTRSLGGKAVIKEINRGERNIKGYVSDGHYYKVSVSYVGKFKPFKLKRKAERLRMLQNEDKLGIASIEKTENADGVCFEVDHPSHLFVVEDYIVTHNTDAGQAWLLYDIGDPRYRALVIRRNADDLKDWIDRARRMYEPTGAEFSGNPTDIKFPSGAIIRTGHLKDENAYSKYQGHEYQKILIEELTHIPRESDYEKLLGSCRSTIPGILPQIFCTTNPDGAGYAWVKNRFSIPDEPKDIVLTKTQDGRTRVFIPARVEDNPQLTTADPQYITYLESIQDVDLRKAWREGSWAGVQVEGAYYRTQINQARADGRITSVPYDANTLVNTWWDLGMNDSTAIGFFQNVGQEIHWIDSFAGEGEGLAYYISVLRAKNYSYGEHYFPHDIEVRELGTGKSRKEVLEAMGVNVSVTPNIPINDGINAVRGMFSRLWIDEEKNKEAIHALSNYRKEFDEKRGTYKDRPRHDWTSHFADMIRYKAVTPDAFTQPLKTKY